MSARDDAIEAIRQRALHMQDANLLDETCESILAAVGERIAQAIEALDSGWTQYQRMPENTTHICYVHENGEVYDPERGWLPKGENLLLDHADPLVSRDIAARIARGGESE